MDIKIITFHRAINYGAVLQAYALYKSVIENAGTSNDVYLFNHRCKHIENHYSPFRLASKSFKLWILNSINLKSVLSRRKKFKNFIKNNFVLTQDVLEDDIFITGSDQVFNFAGTNFDKFYFLDFVKNSKYKNSYAASFGFNEIPFEYVKEYRRLLADFNNLSVREEQGKKIIKKLLNRDVPIVIDPTLLLNQNEWKRVEKKVKIGGKYIFVYLMKVTPSVVKFVENLSKDTGWQVINISYFSKHKIRGAKVFKTLGPEEWLYLIRNAEYVVTNSFHGVAFSVNFNKRFFVEFLPPSSKINSRLKNILDVFDLNDRLIVEGKNIDINSEIDYDRVNSILETERKKSIDYLKNIVDND